MFRNHGLDMWSADSFMSAIVQYAPTFNQPLLVPCLLVLRSRSGQGIFVGAVLDARTACRKCSRNFMFFLQDCTQRHSSGPLRSKRKPLFQPPARPLMVREVVCMSINLEGCLNTVCIRRTRRAGGLLHTRTLMMPGSCFHFSPIFRKNCVLPRPLRPPTTTLVLLPDVPPKHRL